jgi:hypothetical protein
MGENVVVSFPIRSSGGSMDAEQIITELERERDRLTQAIEALTASHAAGARGRKPRRRLSATARKRISDGMRKTWAARKKKERAA